MRRVVFYSWQSDLPNATNRGFIQRALENAAVAIEVDTSIDVEPVIDRDTQGVAGSPDIASTIFAKIASADVFVADVSIVSRPANGRPNPNANVLVEVGYALGVLGHERVILIVNQAFGRIDDLPFDLRARRAVLYNMTEEETDRAIERDVLTRKLASALRAALAHIQLPATDERNTTPITKPQRRKPSPADVAAFLDAIESGFPELCIHALRDIEATAYTTEIEKVSEVIARMRGLLRGNAEVAVQVLKTFRGFVGSTDADHRGVLRAQVHDQAWHLFSNTKELSVKQEAMNLLAELVEIEDLDHILYHVVTAPANTYGVTRALYIMTRLKKQGHEGRIRSALYGLKQTPLAPDVHTRIDELLDHLRTIL